MKILGVLARIVAVCFAKSVINELHSSEGSAWSYKEHDKWSGLCKTGQFQSPIALSDTLANECQPQALVFENCNVENIEITNNGHTVVMDLAHRNGPKPQLSGGGLTGKFTLSNLHFHWPSEHVINGKRYPLESHLVFISDKFSNLDNALPVPFAITVLAILYEESVTVTHSNFGIINQAVEEVSTEPGETFATSESINVFDFSPEDSETFFKYSGSLTTPNCTENINWFVFRDTSSITSEELRELTNIYSKRNELVDFNNRLLQNINHRTVSLRRCST